MLWITQDQSVAQIEKKKIYTTSSVIGEIEGGEGSTLPTNTHIWGASGKLEVKVGAFLHERAIKSALNIFTISLFANFLPFRCNGQS